MKAERIAFYSLAAVFAACLIAYYVVEDSRLTAEMWKDSRNAAAIPTWAAETKAARDQRIEREVNEEAKRQESILAELQALRREISQRKQKWD